MKTVNGYTLDENQYWTLVEMINDYRNEKEETKCKPRKKGCNKGDRE